MINLLNRSTKSTLEEDISIDKSSYTPLLNDGLLSLDVDRVYNEYCSNNLSEISLSKIENMYNDFKIILKMVESLKNEYKNGEGNNNNIQLGSHQSSPINSSSKVTNLIDF